MIFQQLQKKHLKNQNGKFIYANSIAGDKEYEKLYENQNNQSHQSWQKFIAESPYKFTFYNDLDDIDLTKNPLCLWFFKERSDSKKGKDIIRNNSYIEYMPNTLFIFNKDNRSEFKILPKKESIHRRPVVQFEIKFEDYQSLVNKLDG